MTIGRPFVKGQSGNPAGRNRKFAAMARRILELTNDGNELVDFLLLTMRDAGADMKARMHCLEILLDRGLGKVPQTIDFEEKADLSDEDIAAEERIITRENFAKMSTDEKQQLLAEVSGNLAPLTETVQ